MKTQNTLRLGFSARHLAIGVLSAALLWLLPTITHAQAIEAWVQRYNGPGNGDDGANAIAVDTNGNVYVTGSSTAANGFSDYTSIKYSSAGVPLWTNLYNGPADFLDEALAVAVDSSGDVIVTGSVGGSGNYDFLTIKYSSEGVGLWTNQYAPGASGEALAVDASGNVVVAGHGGSGCTTVKYSGAGALLWARDNSLGLPGTLAYTKSIMAVDASGNVVVTGHQGSSGSEDFVTVKYSSTGALLWTRRYNGPGNSTDRYTHVAVDASGNVFVTGESANTNAFPYNYDYATLKYSSAGVPLWTNRYNGPGNGEDSPKVLAVDAGGKVFVTGSSWNGAYTDWATIKYSSTGVPLWTNRSSIGDVYAMAVDPSGNVYLSGNSLGSPSDYLTLAYSNGGLPLWTNRYNGSGNSVDVASGLALDANGNVYVTGSSANNITPPPWAYDHATIKYVVPAIIARQPLSCTNAVGVTVSFTVEAVGSLPLSYQWRRQGTNLVDGGNLSGVTTTNLVIANVQLADAAGYTVVVTNNYGSATSYVAQLTVYIPSNPGRFSNLSYSPETGFSFIFRDATLGQPYRIQRSPSMAEGSWVDWQSFNYLGPVGFSDLGGLETTNRFYRAVTP